MARFDFQPAGLAPRVAAVFHRLARVLQGYHREEGVVRLQGVALELEVLDADPPAPNAGRVRLYAVANAGKTEIRARFRTGAPETIATEP